MLTRAVAREMQRYSERAFESGFETMVADNGYGSRGLAALNKRFTMLATIGQGVSQPAPHFIKRRAGAGAA